MKKFGVGVSELRWKKPVATAPTFSRERTLSPDDLVIIPAKLRIWPVQDQGIPL